MKGGEGKEGGEEGEGEKGGRGGGGEEKRRGGGGGRGKGKGRSVASEKKNDQGGGPLRFDATEQQVPCGQQYPLGVVQRFVSLVIDKGASLRCAAGALELFNPPTSPEENSPAWSTGRLWLLRIGLAALLRPKVIAEDWVWMVDHSIQIGQCKCLVILGIRLS